MDEGSCLRLRALLSSRALDGLRLGVGELSPDLSWVGWWCFVLGMAWFDGWGVRWCELCGDGDGQLWRDVLSVGSLLSSE